jgi:acylphosphatase
MHARLIRIAGRVQGVGFREWMVGRARQLGIAGWVRNRRDGSVEALLAGDEPSLGQMLLDCRAGPPGASVSAIEEDFAEPPEEPGFVRRPTL